jgi:hypothetical protein
MQEMASSDGYLSRDREHLASLQRKRRAYMTRIDYMPGREALAAFEAKRATLRPGSAEATNSAVLDAILEEWAALTGINCNEVAKPMTPAKRPELIDASARAYDSGALPEWLVRMMERTKPAGPQRVTCGAKRHRDGQPCQAKSEPGKRRCRFHGGRSTGPRTPEGKARALANLRTGRNREDSASIVPV